MKYDPARSTREMHQLANLAVVAGLGWVAAAAFGLSLWVAILAAFAIYRPLRQGSVDALWQKPTVRLAFLGLILMWLLSDWSSYRQGVFAGFDAAAVAAQH